MNEIERLLSDWILWMRMRRAFHWALNGAVGGLAFSAGIAFSAGANARLLRHEFLWLVGGLTLAAILLAALLAFIWPITPLHAARIYDQALGLRERLSTALELSTARQQAIAPASDIIRRQYEDALAAARRVAPRQGLPLQVHRWQAALIILLLALLALGWLGGGRYFQAALQKRLVQQAIEKEIAAIQALETQIEQNNQLSPEQKEALTRALDETQRGLQTAESVEQAVAVLTAGEKALQALSDPQAQNMAEGLQQAGKSLSSQADSPLQAFGQNLAKGDYLAAAQDLLTIDPTQLTPEEAQALAEQLEQAAEAMQATNPALAEQLQQAASALKSGDSAAAQEALQQAAQTLAQTGQQIAHAQAAAQAAAQLAQGQQAVIQAGQKAQGGLAQNGQGQAGASDNGQPSQGQGSSGSGHGQGSGEAPQGPEAGDKPIQPANGAGQGGQSGYEQIFSPQRLGGSGGDTVALPGSGNPDGETIGQGNTAPGEPGNTSVPYMEVFPLYSEAYRQAIESGQVPLSLRSVVRQYFTNLQP